MTAALVAMSVAEIPVVILAGGRGARFDHESKVLPKPMIRVDGKPMLRHIIDSFVMQGFREFIIAAGYLGEKIDECFHSLSENGGPFIVSEMEPNYKQYRVEFIDMRSFSGCIINITVANTGEDSHTGERLLKLAGLIGNRRFVLTYGDGLSDVDMSAVIAKHEKTAQKIWWGEERPEDPEPALITVTSVKPNGRFGAIEFGLDDWGVGVVSSFQEKPRDAWINGGFMVVEPQFIERYLWGPRPIPQLESEAMAKCAADGFMRAHKHTGYWRCMDTRRDLEQIEADVDALGSTAEYPWIRIK
jgi:glucose-1-phosphate cytidylyltransferase